METQVFRQPTVGGTLREHYVEARLHNDAPDAEAAARVRKLQDELAGTPATPHYLILDAATRAKLGVFDGPDLGGKKFAEFLNKALP